MSKILVFTDAHDEPGKSQERFTKLGHLILRDKPDIIVQLGDFMNLDSLSRWNHDRRGKLEGRRYQWEVDSAREAVRRMITPYQCYNMKAKVHKCRQYVPQWYWFEGNHEAWVQKYLDKNPELQYALTLETMLDLESMIPNIKYRQYPYVEEIDGIYFTHAPHNRAKEISSKYVADKALEYYGKSIVFGHNHRLLCASAYRIGDLAPQYALSCGCYFEGIPEYAEGTAQDYWRGVILLETQNGRFNFKTISLDIM